MSQREWRELNSRRLTTLLILSFLSLPLGEPVYAQFDPDEIERVYQSKDYAKVEAIAHARLKIDPYDVRARYYLASVLLQQKRGGQALVQYEACVKCGGNSALAQMARKAILALKIDSKKANPQFFVRAEAVSKGASAAGATAKSSASGSASDNGTGPGAASGTASGAASDSGAGSGAPNTANSSDSSAPPDSSDSDVSPANREAIAVLRKDLADAIEVKRRRQSQDLELVGEEENQAILEAAATLSIQRDDMIEAVRVEAAAKRAKIYRLYKEEEESITKAYQARINALKHSYKKAQ